MYLVQVCFEGWLSWVLLLQLERSLLYAMLCLKMQKVRIIKTSTHAIISSCLLRETNNSCNAKNVQKDF
jgi:hypothetical protein